MDAIELKILQFSLVGFIQKIRKSLFFFFLGIEIRSLLEEMKYRIYSSNERLFVMNDL